MADQNRDDLELRRLLDSIGLAPEYSVPTSLTAEERRRAEQMRQRILKRINEAGGTDMAESDKRVRWGSWVARSVVAAALALIMTVAVVGPWRGEGGTAAAMTPALLTFSGVEPGTLPDTGIPADADLAELARLARKLPKPADLPVHNIELDAWWSASAPADETTDARSVLVPVRASHFVLPDGDFRSIERRGLPLDADGLVVDPPDWAEIAPISDSEFALDPGRGPEFPETLPTTIDDLRTALAPPDECAEMLSECLVNSIIELHTTYVLTPELVSNLWSVLQGMSDITVLGTTTDRLNRPALALRAPSAGGRERTVILADPTTGALLGYERVLMEPDPNVGFNPPAVLSFTAVVDSRRIAESDVPDDSHTIRY